MAELSKLGRYELRRILGRGAMGVVYEGFDPNLSRRVAVKTILKSVALDPETERAYAGRFTKEAKAVARLNHPNIVQVYDFGVEDEVAYLVMEIIEGRELRSFFEAKEKFLPDEVMRIMGELLSALDFAHEAGVIHRDVKPANVMLDAQRRVKLADFGVARVQAAEHSTVGTMVGTPAFMSPEQIQGGKIDRRTDIFSAGTILYQLLTGEQPFKGEGAWTVAKKIVESDPPPPSSIILTVSPAFDTVVNKALAKKLNERFSNAREFAAALRGALSSGTQASAIVAPKPKARVEPKASDTELEFWRAIQNSTDAAEFEFYLEQFPDGTYAQLARHKIAKLREAPDAQATVRLAAQERARQEAEEQTRREAEAKAKRDAEERALREALEKTRQAQALARLRQQEEAKARAKAAVGEDATVAIGDAPPGAAPPPSHAELKTSYALPAIGAGVVIVAGIAAYLFLGRTQVPVPVAQIPAPPKIEAAAPAAPQKAELSTADIDKIRKETEDRVRREYADKSTAEQAKAAKAAADKAVQEKQLAAKAAAEKLAADKAVTEKAAAEKAAADRESAKGLFDRGVSYAEGKGVKKDDVQAVEWIRKSAGLNYVPAMAMLGRMYADGKGVPKDDVEAVRWYRKAAEQNNAVGQAGLGLHYMQGRGVSKDDVEALRWTRNAAEQNDARGQNNLGVMYAGGRGVAKDEVEAVRWYRKAAEQNNAAGQAGLGFMYASGRGLAKDEAEAIRWYRKSAEQNHGLGQVRLGVMYFNGQVVAKDETEGVRWFRKAAEQNNALGQANLGYAYSSGKGVAKDDAEAVRWYRKSAEQNDSVGQNNLGIMYEQGRGGLPFDKVEALKLYRMAAAQGHELAKRNITRLENR